VDNLVEALEKVSEYGDHAEPWRDIAYLGRIARAALDEWRK
jgi:hypothetical protein